MSHPVLHILPRVSLVFERQVLDVAVALLGLQPLWLLFLLGPLGPLWLRLLLLFLRLVQHLKLDLLGDAGAFQLLQERALNFLQDSALVVVKLLLVNIFLILVTEHQLVLQRPQLALGLGVQVL